MSIELRLSPFGALEAILPSGHVVPIQDEPKALVRLRRLLEAQTQSAKPEEATIGLPEAPTVQWLEHFENHVSIPIPRLAPGCPFCRTLERERKEGMHELSPKRYAPGSSGKLEAPASLSLEDLDLA